LKGKKKTDISIKPGESSEKFRERFSIILKPQICLDLVSSSNFSQKGLSVGARLHFQRVPVVPERQTMTGSNRISVSIPDLSFLVNTPDHLIWVQSATTGVTPDQPNSLVGVFVVHITDTWHPPASQINNVLDLTGCFEMSFVEHLTGVAWVAIPHSELV
jgi:hypothetical protein